jgi:hypothetical protein
MATQTKIFDGTTRPIVETDDAIPGGHRPEVVSSGGGGGGGGPVTIADGADVTQGAKADAAATSDTGTFSIVALFKRLLGKFTTQFPAALTGSGNFKVAIEESAATLSVGLTALTYTAASTLSITSGGTSQEVFAANASRKALLIINISSEVLWVAFGGAATADTPSIPLQPNNAGILDFPNPGGGIVTQQVQIIGATTGSKFVALQSS